jgi:hypothetical protein
MMQVIVSIYILSMGLVGSMALIIAAIESNRTNINRMTATNLAQEGLEVVRNMRDTNWMTYSTNLRECWNFWDDTDENRDIDGADTDCVPNGSGQNNHPWGYSIEAGGTFVNSYIVDIDPDDFRGILIADNNFNGKYADGARLFKTTVNGTDFYTHDNSPGNTETIFEREIEMYYIDATVFNDTTNPITGGDYPLNLKAQDNRILVISTVSWELKGRTRSVVMSSILTDFLSRTEWSS